jgi:hypothetical protein
MVKISALDTYPSLTTAVLPSRTSGYVSQMKRHVTSKIVI